LDKRSGPWSRTVGDGVGIPVCALSEWLSFDIGLRQCFGPVCIYSCASRKDLRALGEAGHIRWLLVGKRASDADIGMVLSELKLVCDDISLAILGLSGDWNRCERWLRRGCRVYLEERHDFSRLAEAIRAADNLGVSITDPSLRNNGGQTRSSVVPPVLTRRQLEVLEKLISGRRNREIATELKVSVNTVDYHMRQLMSKFEARSRLEVVKRATKLGLS